MAKESPVFQVYPIDRFELSVFKFTEPQEVGSFSFDSERNFVHDRHQLMYYVPPQDINDVSFNLKEGYDSFIQMGDNVNENLDDVLRWVSLSNATFQQEKRCERYSSFH
jgi:hypothetical protein